MRVWWKSPHKKNKKTKNDRKKLSQIVDLVETFQTVIYTPRNSEKKVHFRSTRSFGKKMARKIRKTTVFEKNQAERTPFSEAPGRETPGPKF